MLLAEKKKQENISEYIIYMYQTELLIRNFEFDIEKIKVHVFGNIADEKMSPEKKEKNLAWYAQVINDMKSESLEKGEWQFVSFRAQLFATALLHTFGDNEQYLVPEGFWEVNQYRLSSQL